MCDQLAKNIFICLVFVLLNLYFFHCFWMILFECVTIHMSGWVCVTHWFYGFDCGEITASMGIKAINVHIDSKPVFVFIWNFLSLWLKWLFFIKTNVLICCYENTGRLFLESGCTKTWVLFQCVTSLQGTFFSVWFLYFLSDVLHFFGCYC